MKENILLTQVTEFVDFYGYDDIGEHEHIDALLPGLPEEHYVEKTIEAYQYLVNIVIERELNRAAFLVIHLNDIFGRMADPNNIPKGMSEITPETMSITPPLIAIAPNTRPLIKDHEYYRIPLFWELNFGIEGIDMYYSEYRRLDECEEQGEIDRTITFEFRPSG